MVRVALIELTQPGVMLMFRMTTHRTVLNSRAGLTPVPIRTVGTTHGA